MIGVAYSQLGLVWPSDPLVSPGPLEPTGQAMRERFGTDERCWPIWVPTEAQHNGRPPIRKAAEVVNLPPAFRFAGAEQTMTMGEIAPGMVPDRVEGLPPRCLLSRLEIQVERVEDWDEHLPLSLTWWATADIEGRGVVVPKRTDDLMIAPGRSRGYVSASMAVSLDLAVWHAGLGDGLWIWGFLEGLENDLLVPRVAFARVYWTNAE